MPGCRVYIILLKLLIDCTEDVLYFVMVIDCGSSIIMSLELHKIMKEYKLC